MSDFIFVSPGLKFREINLSQVAQAVGTTSAGMVGETMKGPAFEPVLCTNRNEFMARFGGQAPEKIGSDLKYPLPYAANAFLQEADQLYVTRVLGLGGYQAGKAFVLTSGVDTLDDEFDNKFVGSGKRYKVGQDDGSGNLMIGQGKQVLAVFRSRASYDLGGALTFQVSDVQLSSSGNDSMYDEFVLQVTYTSGKVEEFALSLNPASSQFIGKVFGYSAQDKNAPLYVENVYNSIIRRIEDNAANPTIASLETFDNVVFNEYGVGADQAGFKTPETPWIVSELRGNRIERLFRLVSISDGKAANQEIKISVTNIDPATGEFDLVIRDFYDSDDSIKVLESFTRCSMNPDLPSYIGKRIGTMDGLYDLRSKYVMVDIHESAPADAFPCGFEGYHVRNYMEFDANLLDEGADEYSTPLRNPFVPYKTAYIEDVDRVSRTYLGISDKEVIDETFYNYFGSRQDATVKTHGFHLDINATGQAGELPYGEQGEIGYFQTGAGSMSQASDVSALDAVYADRGTRKFTLVPAGGFDGWDEHRKSRTNTPIYRKNQSLGFDNSDYYAYLKGIRTFSNPEQIYINLFATPGLNFSKHEPLVREAVDMIERERGDALYIIDAPDYQGEGLITNVITDLDTVRMDTSYGCTYFPYIKMRDNQNGANVWVAPTGEVLKNMAYTDKVKQPWFAVAGIERGLTSADDARKKLNDAERGELYKNRINPMAHFPGVGVSIWGNKTLQVEESALDRVNVRRLLLEIRKLISNVGIRLIFDQNDQAVRDEFMNKVQPILKRIKQQRGLYDAKITLDDSDPELLDRNMMLGTVQIKPTRSLEYIGMSFKVFPSGASFEDI